MHVQLLQRTIACNLGRHMLVRKGQAPLQQLCYSPACTVEGSQWPINCIGLHAGHPNVLDRWHLFHDCELMIVLPAGPLTQSS